MKHSAFQRGLFVVTIVGFLGIAPRTWSDSEAIYTAPCDATGHIEIPTELSGLAEGCFSTCASPFDPSPDTCPANGRPPGGLPDPGDSPDKGGFPGMPGPGGGCEYCVRPG